MDACLVRSAIEYSGPLKGIGSGALEDCYMQPVLASFLSPIVVVAP